MSGNAYLAAVVFALSLVASVLVIPTGVNWLFENARWLWGRLHGSFDE